MLDGVVVKERRCPACDRTLRDRGARWCGSCGALLDPAAEAARADATVGRRRWQLVCAAAVAVVAIAVTAEVGGVTGGLVDRARGSSSVADLEVPPPDEDTLDRLEGQRPTTQAPGTVAPTCSRAPRHTCFLWIAEVDDAPLDGPMWTDAMVAGDRVIHMGPDAATLTARDIRDGSVLWSSVTGHPTGVDPRPHTTGDLIVRAADDGMLALDIATGAERWRIPELTGIDLYQVERDAEAMVLAGHHDGFDPSSVFDRGGILAGIDAASGTLLWHHSGLGATVTTGGIGLLLTEDGQLQAYGPDGELGWEVEVEMDLSSEGSVWAVGPVVQVYGSEAVELRWLRDGAPIPIDGDLLAADGDHALIIEIESRDGDGYTIGDAVVLLGGNGEVWRRDDVLQGGCWDDVRLGPTTVEVTRCGGERIELDRSDGTERARTPPDPAHGRSVIRLGPYELRHAGSTGVGDVIVTDTRSDSEVARLPPRTWPVLDGEWRSPSDDPGEVLVLQSQNWLTALELPPDDG